MIFSIIMLVVGIVGIICSCIFIYDNPDISLVFAIFFLIIAVCSVLIIIGCLVDSAEIKNVVSRMRTEPQNFSIQDASEMNIKLAKIDRWENTIFTYYKGFDTTPLDLNKFIKI